MLNLILAFILFLYSDSFFFSIQLTFYLYLINDYKGEIVIEYRKFKRFPVICKSDYTDKLIIVVEMSREGMKIKTSYHFNNNTNIIFTLVLPSFDVIKVNCNIVWDKITDDNEYLYGVHLNDLSNTSEELYMSYIDSLEQIIVN